MGIIFFKLIYNIKIDCRVYKVQVEFVQDEKWLYRNGYMTLHAKAWVKNYKKLFYEYDILQDSAF